MKIWLMGPFLTQVDCEELFASEVRTTPWWKQAEKLKGIRQATGDFENGFRDRLHDGTFLKKTFLQDFLEEVRYEIVIQVEEMPEGWSTRDLETKRRFLKKWSDQE